MNLPSPSNDLQPLVLDASVIINLLATGIAGELLSLLQTTVIVERTAFNEVRRHPLPGADLVADLTELESSGLMLVQDMDGAARSIFRELIAGDISKGLDDGEAATIAFAVVHSGNTAPVIDERKASNLFSRRWTEREVLSSVELIAHDRVQRNIESRRLADALYGALVHARMRVPIARRDWIIKVIGEQRAAECPSLGPLRQIVGLGGVARS